MTDYCTTAEAVSLLGGLSLRDAATGPPVVTATEPTLTQAGQLVTQTSAEIDMHLRGQGYEVPATDSDALAALKAVAMNGAAARIAKARWPNDTGPGGEGGVAAALRDDYRAGLAFIDSGGLGLDSTADTAALTVSHGFAEWTPPIENDEGY